MDLLRALAHLLYRSTALVLFIIIGIVGFILNVALGVAILGLFLLFLAGMFIYATYVAKREVREEKRVYRKQSQEEIKVDDPERAARKQKLAIMIARQMEEEKQKDQ